MAKGSKKKYSSKQKRQAEHIEEGYEKRGTGKKEAERRAWATVNKSRRAPVPLHRLREDPRRGRAARQR